MADIQLLLEAERRGLLPPDKKALLDEARRRGLIGPALPTQPEAETETPGIFGGLAKGTESLISSGRTALGTVFGSPEEAAKAGIQRGEAISKEHGESLSLDKLAEIYRQKGLLPAAIETVEAIPGAIAEQLPNLGATMAGAKIGSRFGPYGTIAGALAPSLIQQYGGDVERQAAEQQARGEEVKIDRGRALEAAAPQAALDVAGEVIPLGGRLAGKLFGKEVQDLIFRGERAAADKLAKESLLTTLGKGTAIGALAEVPTEVAQQALERWNAGLSLTDNDALKEYADTAFQVSLLAPIGAVGRVSERAAARREVAAGMPETPETPEAPTTEEAPPAPKPVEVSPEALAAAKQYSDQIASGQAQFNLFKGRALIRKMGYQIGNDSKFAETKAIFDDLVSGKQVEMPQAGARVAPAAPAEPVDISTLTSGRFVPREEMPRGTATPPVGEAVDTTTGRGAVMPPSGVGAAEPSVAGPQGAGVGPAIGAVETPDVRKGTVQPALTGAPAPDEIIKATPQIDKSFALAGKEGRRAIDHVAKLAADATPTLTKKEAQETAATDLAGKQNLFEALSTDAITDEAGDVETIKGKADIEKKRVAKMLGPQLYSDPKNMGAITIKEILQNSFDAVKGLLDAGKLEKGRINVTTNPDTRTIEMTDNGTGMAPQLLATKFLQIAGTGKDATTPSGGFGIAKMLFLYGNDAIRVVTMKDGKVSEMDTSGDKLFDALEDPESQPDIRIYKNPTAEHKEMFPEGHGTYISLKIPESYVDTQTGDTVKINFPESSVSVPALEKSPLFANIETTFAVTGGRYPHSTTLRVGSRFPAEKFSEFVNVKFPWGTARVYVTPDEYADYSNMHVLSNGLYQFSKKISKNPNDLYSDSVPYTFYVDIKPTVKADEISYPFELSRKKFTESAEKELGKVFKYINAIYAYKDLSDSAKAFGTIQYLDSPTSVTDPIEIKPTIPPSTTAFEGLKQGDKVTVKDGKLFVEGRELPELTTEQLKAEIPKSDELLVDPSLIDADRVMLHDNVQFKSTGQDFSSYMREHFGKAYDSYMHEIGDIFQKLRKEVADALGYDDLLKEAVGLSIDVEYRGVSIRVPFSSSFVNPFASESTDPVEAGMGIFGTMIHELAHHKVRSHNEYFPAEMQKIWYKLRAAQRKGASNFDTLEERAIRAVKEHENLVKEGRRIIHEGYRDGSIEPRGDRFKDASREGIQREEGVSGAEGERGPSRERRTGQPVQPKPVPSAGPAPTGGAPRPTAQAPSTGPVDNKNRTPEQAIKARQDTYKERFTKKSLSERILKYLWGKDAGGHLLDKYEALVKKFQNDLRPALTLEQALKRAGELITYGPGMNDAFSKIASAQDKAAWLTSNMLKVPMDKAYKAIEKFARSRNLTTDQAIEELDRYRIVLHEPERRMIMFMRYVPLSTKRRAFKDSTGKTIQISPAEIRDSILRSLVKPGNDLVANGQAKQLHNVLKALVSDKANLDPLGDSPIKKEGKPLSIDINDDQYSVLAGYSPEFIAKWKQTFDALGTQKPTAEAAIKAIEDVQEVTKELNRQANYWTKPVDNIVSFYNFEHYTPFKGVPGTKVRASAEMTDPNDVRISGEFADADQAMEGRESEADNSVLQSFSDAMYAASRAGRAGVTEAVKNLIEQGHVSGRKIAEITHEQRWLDKDFNLRQYKGKNKLFHYTPDGNIEVYEIANKDLGFLEAIRRPYQVENWTTKMANNLTGFMGQMHTRFSPSFAPLNFPRDVFTNTMSISADIGGKEALNYLSDALFRNVMKGGLFKSGKVSKLISENRIGELRALAKKDPFYADVIELMEEGGRTAYQQAYNIQAQASELEKRLGPDGIVKMGREGAETLGKWADMYNDAFEFTNRVSAYGIMKSNSMAKLKQRFREKNRREPNAQELAQINKAARSEAASFTKNLANFRLIGTAGRQAGGLFMFFRASATGAVRAIDSLLPAFVDEKTALSKAPASIRDNPELAKRFLKDYRENKKRAQYTMYATAAAGAFLYGLALAGADDDDQGRNKVATDDMARWTRYIRLPILGKDTVLQIPWGFGMASFGAIGAQVAALASGNQPAKEAAANIINIATDSFIPLPKSNINVFDNFFGFLVDSATPTLVRPIVEFAMNTDSLGNEIYNSRQSKLSDAFTGGTNVPELYRDVARGLLESTGLSISPNTLYFWMSNYADALNRLATSTYDLRLFASGQREFRGVDDLDKVLVPFDSFIGTKSNYDGRQYENVKNQIEDKQKILKSLEQRPEAYVKYVEKHPMDPDLVTYYNKTVNGELKKLQEEANIVRVSSQLSPQQRRDILKENVRMQNILKRGLIDTFKYYGVKPTN